MLPQRQSLGLPATANSVTVDNVAAAGVVCNPEVPATETGRDVDDTSAPIGEPNLAVAVTAQVATHLSIGQAMASKSVATAPMRATVADGEIELKARRGSLGGRYARKGSAPENESKELPDVAL